MFLASTHAFARYLRVGTPSSLRRLLGNEPLAFIQFQQLRSRASLAIDRHHRNAVGSVVESLEQVETARVLGEGKSPYQAELLPAGSNARRTVPLLKSQQSAARLSHQR
ncbi:hypothetical protein PG996_008499 [Apiospora saccharicola]|uniref:Uncharacterized protein n=1 Tax=Apiospora saccharicola TaxID=335842 RepID=A0ABR1UYR8_9PEZI